MESNPSLKDLYLQARKNGYKGTYTQYIDYKISPPLPPTPPPSPIEPWMTPQEQIDNIPKSPPMTLKIETPEERKVVEERSSFFKTIEEPILNRAQRIRQELGLPHNISIARVINIPNKDLNDEEKKFKQVYTAEVRQLPTNNQHVKLQKMIDDNTFPLPVHPCKYCLCGVEATMSKLLQLTLKSTATPLVKVKEYLQYRWQAIYKHPEFYEYIEFDDIDKK